MYQKPLKIVLFYWNLKNFLLSPIPNRMVHLYFQQKTGRIQSFFHLYTNSWSLEKKYKSIKELEGQLSGLRCPWFSLFCILHHSIFSLILHLSREQTVMPLLFVSLGLENQLLDFKVTEEKLKMCIPFCQLSLIWEQRMVLLLVGHSTPWNPEISTSLSILCTLPSPTPETQTQKQGPLGATNFYHPSLTYAPWTFLPWTSRKIFLVMERMILSLCKPSKILIKLINSLLSPTGLEF